MLDADAGMIIRRVAGVECGVEVRYELVDRAIAFDQVVRADLNIRSLELIDGG
jgi:hypothetical protein